MANAAGATGRREFYLSVGTGYNFDETTGLFTLQNTTDTISRSQSVSNSSYFLYVIGSQLGVQPSENSSIIYLLSNINSTVEIGYQYRGSAGNVSNTRFGTSERSFGSHSSLTVYTSNSETHQERGEYIDTVEADPGTYPDDGIQGDYWYVKV